MQKEKQRPRDRWSLLRENPHEDKTGDDGVMFFLRYWDPWLREAEMSVGWLIVISEGELSLGWWWRWRADSSDQEFLSRKARCRAGRAW